ncbi:MAG: hypothetical protein Kow0080_03480 [Candidatus Promineifilaceae bacterium]
MGIAFLLTLWVQLPNLADPFRIEEDVRNLPWLWQLTDAQLFARFPTVQDEITYLHIGRFNMPYVVDNPGYGLIIQLGSLLFSPLTVVKLLPFLLIVTAVYYAYQLGKKSISPIFGAVFAITFAAINLTLHSEVSVLAGLQRSFVCPLLLAAAYYLYEEEFGKAALVVVLSAVIYIPILPVIGLTYFFHCVHWQNLRHSWREWVYWRGAGWLVTAVLFIIILMNPLLQQHFSTAFTPSPGISDGHAATNVLQNPYFSLDGPKPLFIFFPFIGRGGIASGPSVGIYIGLFLLFLLFNFPLLKEEFHPLPLVFKQMLLASSIVFVLAWFVFLRTSHFLLYIPSRHTQSSLFIILLYWTLINVPMATKKWAQLITVHRRQAALFIFIVAVVGGLALLVVIVWSGFSVPLAVVASLCGLLAVMSWYASRQRPLPNPQPASVANIPFILRFIIMAVVMLGVLGYLRVTAVPYYAPTKNERAIYQFIQTLPKNALIGGHPCTLDDIPIYSQRSILFNCEEYSDSDPVVQTLDAYYSDTPERILTYCQTFGVDYLVVDTNKWLTSDRIRSGMFFYEPYASALQPELNQRQTFYLSAIPKEKQLFSAGPLYVIACNPKTLN